MVKRQTLMDEYLNQVVWFGGLPLRRGDMITYLEDVAKSQDPKNWFRLREAGMLGNYQFNERHGYPPEGTEPYTLAEFRVFVGDTELPAPEKPRARKPSTKRKSSKRSSSTPTSIRGIR